MKKDILLRIGRVMSMLTLFLLPWQTRYIFWRPWVGTTESEFGVISLYATMVFAGIAALSFFVYDAEENVKKMSGKWVKIGGITVLIGLFTYAWWRGYPSVVHAWILNAFFAICVGYISYRFAKESAYTPLKVLLAGLVTPLFLGVWQMCAGFSPESTLLGLATRNAKQLGDAVLMLGQTRILRMYGSFPHPNIFGTALALSYAGIVSFFGNKKKRELKYLLVAGIFIGVTTVTISRSAALAMLCATLMGVFADVQYKKIIFPFIVIIAPTVWILQFIAPELLTLRGASSVEVQSITERVQQVNNWKDVMNHGGILGVGMYGYPEALAERSETFKAAWVYQPVHNVFLLVLAELGVWWTVFFAFVITRGMWIFKEKALHMAPLFVTFWSLAWFDHALWTSWAGIAYVAAVFGILLAPRKSISTLS